MAAVSDTSPLRYLVVIGLQDLLREVVGEIVIPHAVASELSHPSAPEPVRQWLAARPPWLSVAVSSVPDVELSGHLDPGEAEAITLAAETGADFLLIDERLGRRIAAKRGIVVIGALGVLAEAFRLGLLTDPFAAIAQLRAAGFRASRKLLEQFAVSIRPSAHGRDDRSFG